MTTRREFLTKSAVIGAVAAGDFAFLNNLPPLSEIGRAHV